MKKILVIGAGFYGCHIANFLSNNNFYIDLYESNNNLFLGAATNNHNRLHLGFHYPRSIETISEVYKNYERFLKDYSQFVFFPNKNLYMIHKDSRVSAEEYYETYKRFGLSISLEDKKRWGGLINLDRISGIFNTQEGVVDFSKLSKYMTLKMYNTKNISVYTNKAITEDWLTEHAHEYSYIINTTYSNPNLGMEDKISLNYELVTIPIIKNLSALSACFTIMDGQFFSLYLNGKREFGVYGVEKSVLSESQSYGPIDLAKSKRVNGSESLKIIESASEYFPWIKDQEPIREHVSIRVKPSNAKNDSRKCLIRKQGNLISVLAGKISAVYELEDFLKKTLG